MKPHIGHFAELVNADSDRFNHELWTVIVLQVSDKLRVFLRHQEGLFHFPVIEMSKMDPAVVAILTSTGHHHPMTVARPGWVTVLETFTIQVGWINCRRGILVRNSVFYSWVNRFTMPWILRIFRIDLCMSFFFGWIIFTI